MSTSIIVVALAVLSLVALCVSTQRGEFGDLFPMTQLPKDLAFQDWDNPWGLLVYRENVTEAGAQLVRHGQARYYNVSDVNTGRVTVDLVLSIIEFETAEHAPQRRRAIAEHAVETYTFYGVNLTVVSEPREAALCEFEPDRPCENRAYSWSEGKYLFSVVSLGTHEDIALALVARVIRQATSSEFL